MIGEMIIAVMLLVFAIWVMHGLCSVETIFDDSLTVMTSPEETEYGAYKYIVAIRKLNDLGVYPFSESFPLLLDASWFDVNDRLSPYVGVDWIKGKLKRPQI